MENIEMYYDSLKELYDHSRDQIERIEKTERPYGVIETFSITFLALSIIPIIPFLIIFLAGQFNMVLLSYEIRDAQIGFYGIGWSCFIILSALWLHIVEKIKLKKQKKNEKRKESVPTLSIAQMDFLFAYKSYSEFHKYLISNISQHLNNARDAFRHFVYFDEHLQEFSSDVTWYSSRDFSGETYFGPNIRSHRSSKYDSTFLRKKLIASDFLRTFDKYPWLELSDGIRNELSAVNNFSHKVQNRLLVKEDADKVLKILENFCRFLYSFLPEHNANMNDDDLNDLQKEGQICLNKFIEDVNNLSEIDYPYRKTKNEKEETEKRNKIKNYFESNIFFRFFIFLLVLLGVTSTFIILINLIVSGLDINIMISIIVGSSVTGAAGLTVVNKQKKKNNEREKDEL
jgi:hypothetical protein